MSKLSIRMISALNSAANSGTGVMACDGRTGEALIRRGYAVRVGRRGYQRTLEGAAALDPQVAQESEDRIKTEVAAMMAIMDEFKAAEIEATKPSTPQARFLTAIVAGHPAPQNVVGDWRPINACKVNGWVVAVALEGGRVGWEITPEGRAVIGATEPEALLIGRGQNGKGAEARDMDEGHTPQEAARAMATSLIVSGEVFSVREVPGMVPRTHIIRRGVRSLCGRVAGAAGYRLDLGLVDCLVCLDRYTEETRPKACATY